MPRDVSRTIRAKRSARFGQRVSRTRPIRYGLPLSPVASARTLGQRAFVLREHQVLQENHGSFGESQSGRRRPLHVTSERLTLGKPPLPLHSQKTGPRNHRHERDSNWSRAVDKTYAKQPPTIFKRIRVNWSKNQNKKSTAPSQESIKVAWQN